MLVSHWARLAIASTVLLQIGATAVAAQEGQDGLEGRIVIRSDGAVYLIEGGKRYFIQPASVPDDQLGAIPEGAPGRYLLTRVLPSGASAPTPVVQTSAP